MSSSGKSEIDSMELALGRHEGSLPEAQSRVGRPRVFGGPAMGGDEGAARRTAPLGGGASLRRAERYDEKCSTGRTLAFELTRHMGGDPLAEVATAVASGRGRQGGGGDDQGEGQDPGKLGKFHVGTPFRLVGSSRLHKTCKHLARGPPRAFRPADAWPRRSTRPPVAARSARTLRPCRRSARSYA